MNKKEWIEEMFNLLCVSQGAPENEAEKQHLREWAELLADSDYYTEGLTPEQAHDEEMSCI